MRASAKLQFALNTREEWLVGLAMSSVALVAVLVWLFSGRSLQLGVAICAAFAAFAMLRFLEIGAFLTGFIIVGNVAAFIPGSTVSFFGGMLLILVIRKAIHSDFSWRLGKFALYSALFICYFQITGLWANQTMFYKWDLASRILLTIVVVAELINTPRQYIFLFAGCAIGMIFTSISAIRTAAEFYSSGVADQLAGNVTNIESTRFFGHWPDPNIMSMTLTAFLGGVIALWRSRIAFPLRMLMLMAVVTSVAAIMISLSRGGLISCFTVIVMMLAVERKRLAIVSAVAVVIVVLVSVLPLDIFGRVTTLFAGRDASGSERLGLLLSGWNMYWKNPIFGGGMGLYENSIIYFLTYLPHGMISHNTLVDIAVDSGVVGVLLFVCCVVFAIKGLNWKTWQVDSGDLSAKINAGLRGGLIASLISMLTITSTSYVPFWVLFTLCAMYPLNPSRVPEPVQVAAA